mmetsp:Transcript_5358/g.10916  ORF Transcript_5358/g.10916 Transcript_5358/m.10916 type:complete len:131 (+) Transcript_5358:358-750(+)
MLLGSEQAIPGNFQAKIDNQVSSLRGTHSAPRFQDPSTEASPNSNTMDLSPLAKWYSLCSGGDVHASCRVGSWKVFLVSAKCRCGNVSTGPHLCSLALSSHTCMLARIGVGGPQSRRKGRMPLLQDNPPR